MQGWPPGGGAAAGYGSMYQHAGVGGQMPPMRGYGHAGFASADQLHEWQTQNCARTHGSSDQGYHGGGSRYAALSGENGDPPHEHGLGEEERRPTLPHELPPPHPSVMQATHGQPMTGPGPDRQPPPHPVGG